MLWGATCTARFDLSALTQYLAGSVGLPQTLSGIKAGGYLKGTPRKSGSPLGGSGL
jgi:hypothetical protein